MGATQNIEMDISKLSTLEQNYYWDIYSNLKNLAVNRIEWCGDITLDEQTFIENELFHKGYLVNYNNQLYGNIFNSCSEFGKPNYMNLPQEFLTVSPDSNATGETLARVDCVPIYNRNDKRPTNETVCLYSYQLAKIRRTIDINLNNVRMPFIGLGDKRNILSITNFLEKVIKGDSIILADKDMDLESLKIFNTNAPYLVTQLLGDYMTVWNSCLTSLGINNSNTMKRERLITDEVNSNNQLVQTNQDVYLFPRQKACEEIQKKFNRNIQVRFRNEVKQYDDNETEE